MFLFYPGILKISVFRVNLNYYVRKETKKSDNTLTALFTRLPQARQECAHLLVFGQVEPELGRAGRQHHPAEERVGHDLHGPRGQLLLLLLLAGQLDHLLHEPQAVLRVDGTGGLTRDTVSSFRGMAHFSCFVFLFWKHSTFRFLKYYCTIVLHSKSFFFQFWILPNIYGPIRSKKYFF